MDEITNVAFTPAVAIGLDEIKAAADVLSVTIEKHAIAGDLKTKALMDATSASMFAVRSLFSK